MLESNFSIAIIGMGPRGLSTLERFCANLPEYAINKPINIHLIDPYLIGSGKVWRTDQSPHLLMNTVASQITLFTDSSVDCAGPKVPGPSLYDWAKFIALMNIDSQYSEHIKKEASEMQPDSYPTRAFYGHYLEWVYSRIISQLPDHIKIYSYQTRAISLDDNQYGKQVIRLENSSSSIIVDAVILSLGHTPVALSDTEFHLRQFAKHHNLSYITPANPADVDLNHIKAGETVILRGMGLNFFDYMALLTIGRGGQFIHQDNKLIYKASGKEPSMYAGSRRGIPYHARGENEKGTFGRHTPFYLTENVIENFQHRIKKGEKISFRTELWPLIAKEVETVYYMTLIHSISCNCQAAKFRNKYAQYPWNSVEETKILNDFNISLEQRWNWEKIAYPYMDIIFINHAEYREWLIHYLYQDLAEATLGNVSGPVKAALDVLRDLRNEIRLIIDHGGVSGDSYQSDLQNWYTPLNAFLSIGPPASRIEQMIALIEAGILEILGPDMQVETLSAPARFHARSTKIPDSNIAAAILIEARLPETNLKQTTDPLLSYLLNTAQSQVYAIQNSDGTAYKTGGLAVTPSPNQLVDKDGTSHPQRFAFGVPTEGVHWVTAAGIRPGVNSVTLSESDAIARAVLALGFEKNDSPSLYTTQEAVR